MDAKEFVTCWKAEKENLLRSFLQEDTEVRGKIEQLGLKVSDKKLLEDVIKNILDEAFYNLLLGLDGSSAIGNVQQTYKIYDEDNNLISDCGEIEAEAWRQFHGEK